MRVLGLIPARGGSKELPRKNIRLLGGKPLIQHTFECARSSGVPDRIVLSTDDPEIWEVASSFGLEAPFLRPTEYARDDSPMIDVAVHALETLRLEGYEPEALLLLQPTSPLRRPEHVRTALELLEDHDSVCSVVPVPRGYCPHYLMKITPDGFLEFVMDGGERITRRQDVPSRL